MYQNSSTSCGPVGAVPISSECSLRKPNMPQALDRLAAISETAAKTLAELRNRLSGVIVALPDNPRASEARIKTACCDIVSSINAQADHLEATLEGFQELIRALDI